jgi:heat-inducible transcriptional repressor
MAVVTRDGMIRNQVVKLDELVTQDELHSIRNYVNRNFAGWSVPSARAELRRRFELESATYDRVLRQLTVLYEKGLLDIAFTPAVFVDGTANLVGLDLHLTKEKLRELFRALEEKKRLMELLDQFITDGSDELQVQVGLEKAHPSMKDLTLIGVTVHLPGGLETKMAVLGPMRMNYPRVVSAVAHLGEAIRSLPR